MTDYRQLFSFRGISMFRNVAESWNMKHNIPWHILGTETLIVSAIIVSSVRNLQSLHRVSENHTACPHAAILKVAQLIAAILKLAQLISANLKLTQLIASILKLTQLIVARLETNLSNCRHHEINSVYCRHLDPNTAECSLPHTADNIDPTQLISAILILTQLNAAFLIQLTTSILLSWFPPSWS